MQQHIARTSLLLLAGAVLQPCGAAIAAVPAVSATASPEDHAAMATAALEAARIGDLGAAEQLAARAGLAPSTAALLRAQVHAARAQDALASAALDEFFASGESDRERLASAHQIAAELAFARGRYGDAARHAADLLVFARAVRPDDVTDIQQMLDIAEMLAGEPAQRVEDRGPGATVAAKRDKVGLIRTSVRAGGVSEDAVVDTGANLSVASESAAKRMGLRMLEGSSSVGNSVGSDVAVRLGIADTIEFAGARLRNVVFLVIADDQLSFPMVPGGYKIDAIIGLPVLRALGRVQLGSDALRLLPAAVAGASHDNLRLVGSSPFVVAKIAGFEAPLYFDTGASSSSLWRRFTSRHGQLNLRDTGKSEGRAGAGGAVQIRAAALDEVAFAVAGESITVPEFSVELSDRPDAEAYYGVFGNDIVGMFGSMIVDFDRMAVSIGRPLTPSR